MIGLEIQILKAILALNRKSVHCPGDSFETQKHHVLFQSHTKKIESDLGKEVYCMCVINIMNIIYEYSLKISDVQRAETAVMEGQPIQANLQCLETKVLIS